MDDDNWRERRLWLLQQSIVFVRIIMTTAMIILEPLYVREPYHTSLLSGQAWVLELLTGHPERIYSELGVHHNVFYTLISVLKGMGYTDSRYITLEEQLAIFLYASVTGLSIRHLGERFQHSNETISR